MFVCWLIRLLAQVLASVSQSVDIAVLEILFSGILSVAFAAAAVALSLQRQQLHKR